MSAQLEKTLSGFQQLVADDRLGKRVADATKETQKTAEALIWSGGLGVVSTVAAILILLLIYRFVVPARKVKPAEPPLR